MSHDDLSPGATPGSYTVVCVGGYSSAGPGGHTDPQPGTHDLPANAIEHA